MCRVLGVARGGYYAWRDASARPSPRRKRREEIVAKIRGIHEASDATCGSPRVHDELVRRGVKINRKTVERYMEQHDISPVLARKFVPQTTDSEYDHPVADNLLDRQFTADAPNRKWVTDITYVWTDQGRMYLAGVMDLYSRRIVGWAMAEHRRADLCVEALKMAVSSRRPEPGLLHHSDRGSQYASDAYRQTLGFHGMTAGMSSSGNCYDNAPMKSF